MWFKLTAELRPVCKNNSLRVNPDRFHIQSVYSNNLKHARENVIINLNFGNALIIIFNQFELS